MKHYVKTVFLLLAASLSAFAQTSENKVNGEPKAKEVLQLIFQHSKTPLSVDESCSSVGSSPNDKTIGDYLAGLLSFQAEPDTKNRIEFSTRSEGEGAKRVWVNDLMFLGEDGETTLSYGIRISLYDSSRKFVKGSIKCIGAG